MDKENTIVWSDRQEGFTTFLSYSPDTACSINNRHISFKNGLPWIHNCPTVNRNSFYNDDIEPTTVTLVVNDEPSVSKSLKTVSIEGEGDWDVEVSSNIESVVIDLANIDYWTIDVIYSVGDMVQNADKVWRSTQDNNKNRLPGGAGNDSWAEVLSSSIPETRTIAGTIDSSEFVTKEGKKHAYIRGIKKSPENIDIQASNIFGVGVGEFTSQDAIPNIGVEADDFVPDPSKSLGIDGDASFINRVINLGAAIEIGDSYGFQYNEIDEDSGIDLNGTASFNIQRIDSAVALSVSSGAFRLATNDNIYHSAVTKDSATDKYYLYVGDPTNSKSDTGVSYIVNNVDGTQVYSTNGVDFVEQSTLPFFNSGIVTIKELTSQEYNDLIDLADTTIGSYYLLRDSHFQYFNSQSFPMITTAQYRAVLVEEDNNDILYFGLPFGTDINVDDRISLRFSSDVYENLQVTFRGTTSVLPGGMAVGVSIPSSSLTDLEEVGTMVPGVENNVYFGTGFTLFQSATIPRNAFGERYEAYLADGLEAKYLYVTLPDSTIYPNTWTDGESVSAAISTPLDTVRVNNAILLNETSNSVLGGHALRLSITQDEADALKTIGARANPDDLTNYFFESHEVQIYDGNDVPTTGRGVTFKASLDDEGRFVLSVPDGVSYSDGDTVSLSIGSVRLNGLTVAHSDYEATDITGGDAILINLTPSQISSVFSLGTLVASKAYFIPNDVLIFKLSAVPLVRRGVAVGGITSPVIMSVDDKIDSIQLIFLIEEEASVNVGDDLSIKAWRLGYRNGSPVKSPTQIDPIQIENLTAVRVGNNNLFPESAVTVNLTQAQADLLSPIAILERESNPFIFDEDGDDITDHTGDELEDGGEDFLYRYYLPVQIEIFQQPNVPFDKVTIAGELSEYISVEDELMYYSPSSTSQDGFGETAQRAGVIRDIVNNEVEFRIGNNPNPQDGSYFFAVKDAVSENKGIKGHFHEVTLRSGDNDLAELYAVNTNLAPSSQ